MDQSRVNILIGGEAGQGLATIGQLMAKALVRSGYEIHVTQDYMSRIRGGHNTFAIRTGPYPVTAPAEEIDVLVALDQETLDTHKGQLSDQAVVVAGESFDTTGVSALRVPYKEISDKKLHWNIVALGVLASTVCGDFDILSKLVSDTFAKKGREVVDANLQVLKAAYEWVGKQDFRVECMPPPMDKPGERIMLNGNEAVALGAMAAGCDFCSFYPMTPSTSIALTLIAKGPDMGVVVEQVEDEIAAMNMALGASFAGARPIVTTSGGGFALMIEGVSLAGMIETPVVVALVQRPGPATGLPTRTEQGDLNMVLYAGHGEFPRAVLAPGTVEQCFYLAHRAFEMAEKHQSPAFILSDQYLADSYRAVAPFDLDGLPPWESAVVEPGEGYKRYALAEDGLSPRAVPGQGPGLVVADSDEHDEQGHITEDHGVRISMVEKRLAKGRGLAEDALAPDLYGDKDPEALLVCWGSTLGPALEAAEALSERGTTAGVLHFSQVYPLVESSFMDILEGAGRAIMVEGNATGQFAALVRQATGFEFKDKVLRFDGLPFTSAFILKALDNIL